MSAIVLEDRTCHLDSAFVATTGAARTTWLPQCVCPRYTRCAEDTHRWSTGPPTSSTFRDTGLSNPGHRIILRRSARALAGAWVTGKGSLYPASLAWVTGQRVCDMAHSQRWLTSTVKLCFETCFATARVTGNT
eukprot:3193265-Amphidinium_carterae.1